MKMEVYWPSVNVTGRIEEYAGEAMVAS